MQEKAVKSTKRIKQISVIGLFGMFNHIIPLHIEDRITIIHGPNGFGKTAILKLVNALFSQASSVLEGTPFSELRIDFEDETRLAVTKNSDISSDNENTKHFLPKWSFPSQNITFQFITQEEVQTVTFPSREPNALLISAINNRNMVEALELKPGQKWSVFIDTLVADREINQKETEWLSKIRSAVVIHLIETQRLLNEVKFHENLDEKESVMIPTVTTYSQELAETIKTKLAESTALSQSLDRTFPARLVSPTTRQRNVTEDELRNKLVDLEDKRTRLTAAGLIDQDSNDAIQIRKSDEIDQSTKVVLSVYAEDAEKKIRYL